MKIKQSIVAIAFIFFSYSLSAQWLNRVNGQGDFTDNIKDLFVDPSGNIVLAGSTMNPGSQDILLIKMKPNGDTLWTNVYNGTGSGADDALAIVGDATGNVYATGYQKRSHTGTEMATIKYKPSGKIEWITSYGFLTNQYNQGNSIAIDGSGNVFVAGESDSDPGPGIAYDYVVIKYNNAGVQQWVQRYHGAGPLSDKPVKIAVDPAGNPVVTGYASNGLNDDYLTIKYKGSTGALMWTKLYDRTRTDRATGLVINPSNGNIYVTGRTKATFYDYGTICYDPNGTQLWASVYTKVGDNRATDIGLDPAGNIIVTGQCDIDPTAIINYDITTIQYNSSGTLIWSMTYGGAAKNDDVSTSLFVDASGNVLVAGKTDIDPTALINNDYIALKYTNAGALLTSNTFGLTAASNDIPSGIAADASGNMVITGTSESIPQKHASTLMYSTAGLQQWFKSYTGIGDNTDQGLALATDANGNTFIAGYTVEYNMGRNFCLVKINPDGYLNWFRKLNGSSTLSADEATTLALDGSGNIYVAGFTKNKSTSYDITLAKYNQIGDTLWVRSYNNTATNSIDKASALTLDAAGNVYITGRSTIVHGASSNEDIVTLKYNAAGVIQWVSNFNGVGNGIDVAKNIKVGPSGNVYVSGKTFNGSNYDLIVLQYNGATGAQQWKALYDRGSDDECLSMQTDNTENVFLTGYSKNSAGNKDITTLKLDAAGLQKWVNNYDGTAGGNDVGKDIAIDASGNLLVAGAVDADKDTLTLNDDICTLKYAPDGTQTWVKLFNGKANANDNPVAISVDNTNAVFTTGFTDKGGIGLVNYDYVTIKYLSSGKRDTVNTYNGPGNGSDTPTALLVNANGVYITGGSFGKGTQQDIASIKYDSKLFLTVQNNVTNSLGIQIYPNPFSTVLNIDVSQLKVYNKSSVKIIITDISGREILEMQDLSSEIIKIPAGNLPAGMYFIKIMCDAQQISSSKIIVQ